MFGGISVLRALRTALPSEHFIYYGDNLNAPYGTRPEHEIRLLTQQSVRVLTDQGVKALVIACNTATSAAADDLRRRLTLPIIGMEPALKPAALSAGGGRILVMATPATLRQKKFQELMGHYGQRAEMLPCPGLMEFAERGEMDSPALDAYLADRFAPFPGAEVSAIVLGCTHYVFLPPRDPEGHARRSALRRQRGHRPPAPGHTARRRSRSPARRRHRDLSDLRRAGAIPSGFSQAL